MSAKHYTGCAIREVKHSKPDGKGGMLATLHCGHTNRYGHVQANPRSLPCIDSFCYSPQRMFG